MPHERSFTVAAGTEAELEVALAPPETPPPAARPKRHDMPAGSKAGGQATTPPPASKPRHRDGLVGDDIFDGK